MHDKRIGLTLASIKCWLAKRVDGEVTELETFEQIDPQADLREQIRERRKAGEKLEAIAKQLGISYNKAWRFSSDIEIELTPTETEVLMLLEDGEVWKTSDIEKQSKFTRQRTTIAIKKLVDKEIITKIKRGHYQKSDF